MTISVMCDCRSKAKDKINGLKTIRGYFQTFSDKKIENKNKLFLKKSKSILNLATFQIQPKSILWSMINTWYLLIAPLILY